MKLSRLISVDALHLSWTIVVDSVWITSSSSYLLSAVTPRQMLSVRFLLKIGQFTSTVGLGCSIVLEALMSMSAWTGAWSELNSTSVSILVMCAFAFFRTISRTSELWSGFLGKWVYFSVR